MEKSKLCAIWHPSHPSECEIRPACWGFLREVWRKKKIIFAPLTSAATHSFHVLVWLSHNTCWFWTNNHTHTHRMFLAEAKIRLLSKPRTRLTLFCLFLASEPEKIAALLDWQLLRSCHGPQPSSSHYDNTTPHRRGVKGHIDLQLQRRGWESRHQQEPSRNQDFKRLKRRQEKKETVQWEVHKATKDPWKLISSVEEMNDDVRLSWVYIHWGAHRLGCGRKCPERTPADLHMKRSQRNAAWNLLSVRLVVVVVKATTVTRGPSTVKCTQTRSQKWLDNCLHHI